MALGSVCPAFRPSRRWVSTSQDQIRPGDLTAYRWRHHEPGNHPSVHACTQGCISSQQWLGSDLIDWRALGLDLRFHVWLCICTRIEVLFFFSSEKHLYRVIGFLVLCTFIYIMHRPFPARCSASTLQSSTCLPRLQLHCVTRSTLLCVGINGFGLLENLKLFLKKSRRSIYPCMWVKWEWEHLIFFSKKVEVAMFKYKSFLYFLKYIGK